jgi:hypothetical protein
MWKPLHELLTSPSSSDAVKTQTLWVIGTAIQNNPSAQKAVSNSRLFFSFRAIVFTLYLLKVFLTALVSIHLSVVRPAWCLVVNLIFGPDEIKGGVCTLWHLEAQLASCRSIWRRKRMGLPSQCPSRYEHPHLTYTSKH